MNSFMFNTTATIICEVGVTKRLSELLPAVQNKKAMLVTDKGIIKAGLLELPLVNLKSQGYEITVFDAVEANPKESTVLSALETAKQHDVEMVIGFGGGSSMDVAKLVAYLSNSIESLNNIYGVEQTKSKRSVPLILVPTTAGTGSEVTPIAIVTTGTTEKKGVVSEQLYPDIAVLDAELTLDLPAHITAATGVDAMVHALEAYTSKHKKNPLSDNLAREALRLLAGNIEEAVHNGQNNIEARFNMLLGSMLAGQAFANAPVAAVHALAYPVGALFHVTHGLSNALVLPHVLRFNASACAELYAEVAKIISPQDITGSTSERAAGLANYFAGLAQKLGMATKLSEVGINDNDVPKLAEDAMKQQRLLVNNPRQVTYDDAIAIYDQAL